MTTENAKRGDSRLDQVIAGEYVLGVLSPEERSKVEARMRLDRNFAAMVTHWQSNMMAVETRATPSRGKARRPETPAARPRAKSDAGETVALWKPLPNAKSLWNSVGFWRGLAGVASFCLVAIGVSQSGLVTPGHAPVSKSLAVAGSDLALRADYDPSSGALTLIPAASPARTGAAMELWLSQKGGEPVSLGTLDRASASLTVPPALRGRFGSDSALTLSLEPAGTLRDTVGGPGPILATTAR
ncbi:anti-sigma factor domain-containing protein [Rhizobium sp. YIM 134829]|uniref:anti-sigma factor n=1 Tax=Rhizobium sp. YIM 134829 TaxID=3390453 RepID=UPI00397D02FC